MPTLVIHGRRDTMASCAEAQRYVATHSATRFVTLDAGHFAMLVRSDANDRAVRTFVSEQLRGSRAMLAE